MKTRLGLGIVALACFVVAGCASTKVTSTWQAPQARTAQMHRVLVVGAIANEPVRRRLEDKLTAELDSKGMKAVPSYHFAPQGSQLTRDDLKDIATGQSFDGVLVVDYLGTEANVRYVPPTTYYDFYGALAPSVYGPGYYESYNTVKAESRLFSVPENGQLLWSARAETYDPSSGVNAADKIAHKVAMKLHEDLGV